MKRVICVLFLSISLYPVQDILSGIQRMIQFFRKQSAVRITTTNIPPGEIALAYTATLFASGGHQPYSWSIGFGSLPVGLTLSALGVIAGTPASIGSTFTAQVSDWTGRTASMTYTINIAPMLVIVSNFGDCPRGTIGVPYACQVVVQGGVPPYNCSVDPNGALPAGLTLDPVKCLVSGTPTQAGTFRF